MIKKLSQTVWIAALPFIIASVFAVSQRKWYWAVSLLCFAAYNVGTRLRRLSVSGKMIRGLLTVPWGVLTVMEIIAGRWLGVVFFGGFLIWHAADKRTKEQRVA